MVTERTRLTSFDDATKLLWKKGERLHSKSIRNRQTAKLKNVDENRCYEKTSGFMHPQKQKQNILQKIFMYKQHHDLILDE